MYCKCGSTREMTKMQEKQEGQAVGETVYYYHCKSCTRNYVPPVEKKKMEEAKPK